MRFAFSDDQRTFQESVRGFLEKECPASFVRGLAETETGRSPELWAKLGEIGLLGVLVPETHGGLGLSEVDLVLLLEETGRVALPGPVVESALVGSALLAECGAAELGERWLARAAAGQAILTVGHAIHPVVADAHVADLLLLQSGDELHALPRASVTLEAQPCHDPARRLFTVGWTPSAATRLERGERAHRLLAAALDRGALGVSAQLVGIAQRLVEQAVDYAEQREQFGRKIGSFQAIKHMLASVQVRIEFARPVVYRAADSVARAVASRAVDVSQAKAAAADAALLAAKTALQVHGAIGYTWEVDLHLWMKRAWALEPAWGSRLWHRARIAHAILDSDDSPPTFGFSARRERPGRGG